MHEVRIAAISAVVDLLMRHGLASFITATNTGGSFRKSSSEVNCHYKVVKSWTTVALEVRRLQDVPTLQTATPTSSPCSTRT